MQVLTVLDFKSSNSTTLPLVTSSARLGYRLHVLQSDAGSHAYHAKVLRVARYLATLPPTALILFADGFDSYLRHPPSLLLKRFHELSVDAVFSSELSPNHITPSTAAWYRARSPAWAQAAYINTGLFMGKAEPLEQLLRVAARHPLLHQGSKLRTDQAAIGETFVNLSASLNITLDYNESIFYTAANIRWSLSRARNDIMSREAVAVHMPFTQAPRVARTFHALYAWETGDTFAWPELNHTYCVLQEKLCLRDPNRIDVCHVGPGHHSGLSRLLC